jgi:hypothetical protein
MAFKADLPYKTFQQRNPEYDCEYWSICRALYAGGKRLLANRALMKVVFPQHAGELAEVYEERVKRAFYIPYAGEIIDAIVAELTSKPLTMSPDNAEEPEKTESEKDPTIKLAVEPSKVDPFFEDFFKNVSEPGGKPETLNQLLKSQILTALTCGRAWTLTDLPAAPTDGYSSLAEQEANDGLRAYAASLDPECVIDWEYEKNGALSFILVHDKVATRADLEDDRDTITERFRYWTKTDWAVYEITYSKKPNVKRTKDVLIRPNGPNPEDRVKLVRKGTHSAGRVPVIELKLPEGLWAMAKIEAIARSHFNQRSALSWAQLRALFPTPVAYLQNEPNPLNEISQDEGRALQPHGVGYMRVMSEKDRLEWFSPDTAPFQVAQEDLSTLRDEMHRVLHHMALSVDNSGAALQRSAESKSIDQAATSVILRALGQLVREHAEDIYETIEALRAEQESAEWRAAGMEDFEDTSLTQLIADAMTLESVMIPSATFQKLRKLKLAKRILGADCTPEVEKSIQAELDAGVTQDVFDPALERSRMEVEAGLKAPAQPPIQEDPNVKAKLKSQEKIAKSRPKPKAPKKTKK